MRTLRPVLVAPFCSVLFTAACGGGSHLSPSAGGNAGSGAVAATTGGAAQGGASGTSAGGTAGRGGTSGLAGNSSNQGGAAGTTASQGGASGTAGTTASQGGTNGTAGSTSTQGGTSGTAGSTSTQGGTSGTAGTTSSQGGTNGAAGTTSTQGGAGGGATGGAGAGGSGGVESHVPVLSDLVIEPNPNMTISCFVSWTTDVPSSSEVQFGVGGYQFHIVDGAAVTQHRLLVIGMHADTEYAVRAVSANSIGSSSADGTFTTGALPPEVPVGQLTVSDFTASQPGWTLTNALVHAGSTGTQATVPAIVVMYDEDAIPVWYFIDGSTADRRGDVATQLLPNGHVLVGPTATEPPREVDLAGDVVWEGPAQPTSNRLSHEAKKLSNGNYVLLREVTNSAGLRGPQIEEISPALDLIWSWNIFDHVVPPPNAPNDWCHGNAVTIDEQAGLAFLNCRFFGLFQIRRAGDQGIDWQMGASILVSDSGDVTYVPPESKFSDSHDPELHDDGTILFYDNGGFPAAAGLHSRVVEYALDRDAKMATPVWEFPGSFSVPTWYAQNWYTPIWGDADRLANGNVLVTAGMRGTGTTTHIFEVRPSDGQVVWEMTFPDDIGSYRADRLSPPPLVEALP